ncbi:PREDICTED: uncharacterized protein LOC105956494 [Erythranthe guttata]|uniref:uncharacterized protein LOC105956494 n=1 Tax=Erythranthe guttata TaxID=4155 RepID=UPI00064D7E24|nr:PREDICTED: uncharacterized protein LOC105956494 [Erythranthe guttata]|eukprot:XP_012835805.1 PREDICTED: uncharacterized protein LOC105956494 [Erythranthe guttata]
MGWSYPESSMADLIKLIETFIDMLILASGYQSSGRLAHWDSHNIIKCFHWALFLENVSGGSRFFVSKKLTSSIDYEASVKELDAALYELTCNPHFPQGLARLSCSTLGRSRDLLLEHLVLTLPLRDSHLKAIMSASVEMDFSKRLDNDCVDVYVEKLMRIPLNAPSLSESGNFVVDSNIPYQDAVRSGRRDDLSDVEFSASVVRQLGRRQLSVSCSSAVETGLEKLSKIIGQSMNDEVECTSNTEPRKHSACQIAEELPVDSVIWSGWRSKSLSYMLDKRTIRLLSGASLIFSAPEDQWAQTFKRLDTSAENDDTCEIIELLLLGCIADGWSALIEHLMSVSYDSPTVSMLYHQVFNLQPGNSVNLPLKGLVNPKVHFVIGCLFFWMYWRIRSLWAGFYSLAGKTCFSLLFLVGPTLYEH